MGFSFSALHPHQKSLLTEIVCLVMLSVLIPFANGTQLWPEYSYTFSLILVTSLTVPSVILFYRWFLPFTIGRQRYGYFFFLFPVFLVIYEINTRLASIIGMSLPFVPKGYRDKLASVHPQDFSLYYVIQTPGYTFLVLLAATSLYMARRGYERQHRVALLENEKLRLELTHLKLQLQPHFFFNTLNNLYALSTQGSPRTSQMIADLSAIMRYVLYESVKEKVSLQQEVQFIQSYIELESIRHSDPDLIHFDIQGNIADVAIEPLLLLPLVENAFKHSLAKDIRPKFVRMVLAVDEDELLFQISNPVVKTPALSKEAGGIGLRNLKKRLELLYPGSHQLDIDHGEQVYIVLLTIRQTKQ